jgi:hypothetical protein
VTRRRRGLRLGVVLLAEERDEPLVLAQRLPAGIDFAKAAVPAAVPVGPDGRDLLLVVDDGRTRRVYVRTGRATAR